MFVLSASVSASLVGGIVAAQPMPSPALRQVPHLKGHREGNEVSSILERAGLRLGAVTRAHSDDPVGTVTAQDPEPDQWVPRWTPVAITVSIGPNPDGPAEVVPDAPILVGGTKPTKPSKPTKPTKSTTPAKSTTPTKPTTPTNPTNPWLITTIVATAILAGIAALRRLARPGNTEKEEKKDKPRPDLQIHAVQDEGTQRLTRAPSTVSVIGISVHPDIEGRQRVRFNEGGERPKERQDQ